MDRNKIKYIILAGLIILMIIFLIQNAETVEIQLIFWPMAIPKSLLILISAAFGALDVFILRMLNREKNNILASSIEHKTEQLPDGST